MANVTLKLYETGEEIEKATTALAKAGVKFQTEAHRLACSVLAHVAQHKDVRVVAKFLDALPDLSRKNAVKAWFENFGPVAFDTKGVLYAGERSVRLGDAMAEPFWKFSPEPVYKPIKVEQALESLIKRLKKDTIETGRNHSATIAALMCVPAVTPEVTDVATIAALMCVPAVTPEVTEAATIQ